jgi:hypothetical protein
MRRLMRQFGPPAGAFGINHDSPQAAGLTFWAPLIASRGVNQLVAMVGEHGTGDGCAWASDGGLGFGARTTDKYTDGSGLAAGTYPEPQFPHQDNIVIDSDTKVSVVIWYSQPSDGRPTVSKLQAIAGPQQPGYIIGPSSGGAPSFFLRGTTSSNDRINISTGAAVFNDGLPHCMVVTYTGSSAASGVTIYVDGISYALTTHSDALVSSSATTTPLLINHQPEFSNPGNRFYNKGNIFDIRFYNRVLTPTEVQHIYAPETRFDLYRTAQRVGVSYAGVAAPSTPATNTLADVLSNTISNTLI